MDKERLGIIHFELVTTSSLELAHIATTTLHQFSLISSYKFISTKTKEQTNADHNYLQFLSRHQNSLSHLPLFLSCLYSPVQFPSLCLHLVSLFASHRVLLCADGTGAAISWLVRGVGVRAARGRESWEDFPEADLDGTETKQPIAVVGAGEG